MTIFQRPFPPANSLARLRAVTRRSTRTRTPAEPAPSEELIVGPLRISPETRAAGGRHRLDLTPVEFDLLVSWPGQGTGPIPGGPWEEARDRNYDVFDRSIDVHISALRKKLGTIRKSEVHPDLPGSRDTC